MQSNVKIFLEDYFTHMVAVSLVPLQGMAAVYLITYLFGYHVWKFSLPFFHYRVSPGNLFEIIMHGKSQTEIPLCCFKLLLAAYT